MVHFYFEPISPRILHRATGVPSIVGRLRRETGVPRSGTPFIVRQPHPKNRTEGMTASAGFAFEVRDRRTEDQPPPPDARVVAALETVPKWRFWVAKLKLRTFWVP